MKVLVALASFVAVVASTGIYFDGRVPLSYTTADLDASAGPYLTVVKGSSQNASHYTSLLGRSSAPTPLWSALKQREQVLNVKIDNSSVFVPGGNPQRGFRRTELLAQKNGSHAALEAEMETGRSVFHFSVAVDEKRPLNYSHEYQVVFIEPSDGSHVFGIQLGSPFTNPTGPLPAKNARNIKVLDHALNVLYTAPFTPKTWHNFAVQVDWAARTLGVLYSAGGVPLRAVTRVMPNAGAAPLPEGRGEFHIGLLKLPLVNTADAPANQGDVVHHGVQEGTTEGLLYSGVFVENAKGGVSAGYGLVVPALA